MVVFGAVFLKWFGTPTVHIPIVNNSCTAPSNFVISQKKLNKVQNCTEEKYTVDKKDVYFVGITYGEAQDCPAGCFYSGYTGLVEENNIIDFSAVTLESVNNSITIAKSEICSVDNLRNVTLVREDGIYKWKVTIDQSGNTLCAVKGDIFIGADGVADYSHIVDSTPALNCENPEEAHAACLRKNVISGVSCNTEQQNKNMCLYFKAKADSKLEICDQIVDDTDTTDLCYYAMAVKLHDRTICDKRNLGMYYKNNCEQYATDR